MFELRISMECLVSVKKASYFFVLFLLTDSIFATTASSDAKRPELVLSMPLEDVSSVKIYGQRFSEFFTNKLFGPLGYSIKLVYFPTKRSLLMSDSGHIDGEAARIEGLRKHGLVQNLLKIEPSIGKVEAGIFANAGHPDLSIPVKMKGEATAIQRGMVIWKPRAERHGFQVVNVESIGQGLEMIEKKRIRYFVGPSRITEKVIAAKKMKNKIVKIGNIGFDKVHIWLHKRHVASIPEIEKRLLELKKQSGHGNLHLVD